ncbi:MAG: hypothetical protein IPO58_26510 [Betaproteobacteria bacterium]|nr:hypothetical protein [Betaproteobacteria bacterium]
MTGGMLLGRDYAIGASDRGIAGLFGRYDYLAPQMFGMSSTAFSLGTVGQVWLTESVALQGTGMVGVGERGGSARCCTAPTSATHHYGVAPQAMLALRLIVGDSMRSTSRRASSRQPQMAPRATKVTTTSRKADAVLTWRITGVNAVLLAAATRARRVGLKSADRSRRAVPSAFTTRRWGMTASAAVDFRRHDTTGAQTRFPLASRGHCAGPRFRRRRVDAACIPDSRYDEPGSVWVRLSRYCVRDGDVILNPPMGDIS